MKSFENSLAWSQSFTLIIVWNFSYIWNISLTLWDPLARKMGKGNFFCTGAQIFCVGFIFAGLLFVAEFVYSRGCLKKLTRILTSIWVFIFENLLPGGFWVLTGIFCYFYWEYLCALYPQYPLQLWNLSGALLYHRAIIRLDPISVYTPLVHRCIYTYIWMRTLRRGCVHLYIYVYESKCLLFFKFYF